MDRDTNVTKVTEVQAGRGPARDSVILGKYRVESTLGFGGMGIVIKALNLDLNQYVAIKLLREDVQLDEENVTRFVREAKNAVKLKSEHVARILDVGTFEDGRPFMVMELLEGADLGKLLLDQGAIERSVAVDLLLQACDAIGEAHALGIVHRDIKPTNLFVTKRRDGSELLKVLDFGISKATLGPDMSLTQTQSMLGTPAYMSPEQMRSARTVDRRSDIWSLGCVLYELVEGHAPFEAENFAELCVMVSIEPFIPLAAARELGPVIDRVLAKKVDDRFQDVAELAYALEKFAGDAESARRQVARVFRLLGRSHPDGRDSTPSVMSLDRPSRGSVPRMESKVSYPALPQTPAPSFVSESNGRWKAFAFLGLLAGIGIAAGLYFGGGNELPAPASEQSEPAAAGSTETNPMTVERADSAVDIVESDDQSGSALAAGSATESVAGSATIKVAEPKPAAKPPIRKQPPRRIVKTTTPKPPPKSLPTETKPTPTATKPIPAATKPPPPKPKCDPFDNPNGCN